MNHSFGFQCVGFAVCASNVPIGARPKSRSFSSVSMIEMSLYVRAFALSCVLLMLSGCATAPETGRSQILLIDSAQEAQIGLQSFQKIKRQTPVSRDRKANAQLQSVGRRIANVVSMPHAQWEFVLFESKEPNAFALPGGKIGVNTGILPITKNEAGLATVIAHEIAHVTARHGAERMSQGLLVQVGGTALSAALGGQSSVARDVAKKAYGIGTQVGVMLPYSRVQEYEADRIGLLYMARAGFDPNEAVGFWQRFQARDRNRGSGTPEFLSTHPLNDARIEQIQRFLPEALAEYERARR
jgi:metalloendopeptidase OMA1, mitochondrial